MKFTNLVVNLMVTAAFLLPLKALAEETSTEADDWSFGITPYIWASGLEGDVASLPPLPPIEVDASFSDIVENLDMTFMGIFEAREGRVGLFADILYLSLSADSDTPGPFYNKTEYEQDLLTFGLGASYSISQSENYFLDILGAIRLWDLDNNLKLTGGAITTPTIAEHEKWQDIVIGLKGKYLLNSKLSLLGWTIVSVGGDSESVLDLFGAIGYDFNDLFTLSGGYRHLEVEYKNDGFLFDVAMSGPSLGFAFHF